MKILFKTLKAENFKNHKELFIEFGEETAITGGNGKGKTGIGEMFTWLLHGVDRFGSKFDPSPTNYEGSSKVELLLNVDGKDLLLGKELQKNAKYYVNEIPQKATFFDNLIADLFDKNLFLSIFSPGYFFSQHWQDQRSQLLKYVSEPLEKEVLDALLQLDRERLQDKLKKHSLEDLDKKYRPQIKSKEVEYERAAERFLTLKEQLEKDSAELKEVDKAVIASKMEKIKKIVKKAKEDRAAAQEKQDQEKDLINQMNRISADIQQVKEMVLNMLDAPVKDTCEMCGQALAGEALEKVQHHHDSKIAQAKKQGASLVNNFKALKEKMDDQKPQAVEVNVNLDQLQEKYYVLQNDFHAADRIAKLSEDVKNAEANKNAVRLDLGEARGIIDSIKKFETKKSEMMVKKVNGLLDLLSVKLFEIKKNGSVVPTFEVEMDGKPYSKLSTAEKIKAGLELAEVLINQSEQSIPVFVDNTESILQFKAPSAQLITAKVKSGELKIEAKGAIA